jgi:hypothetical protein
MIMSTEDRETKHAHFIVFESGIDGVSCFLPESQIEIDEDHKVVTMPEWLVVEKELI